MSKIYFGGSRTLPQMPAVVETAVQYYLAKNYSLHVGCQIGADQFVIQCASYKTAPQFNIFSISQSMATAPRHITKAYHLGANVTFNAGGSAPMKARFLLRSIAAFQSCDLAVFFYPGAGSLAVARECIKSQIPVFAFGEKPPRPPSTAGAWQAAIPPFLCYPFFWQFIPAQITLF